MALTVRTTEALKTTGSPSPVFNGIVGLSYLGAHKRKSTLYGEQWVLEYRSAASNDPATLSPCATAYNVCPDGYTAELREIGADHYLTVTTPDNPGGTTTPTAHYELLGNELQKDMREHPNSLALGEVNGQRIIEIINNVLNGAKNDSNPPTFINTVADIPPGWATTLYRLLLQGNGNRMLQVSQYVASYSISVPNTSTTVNIAYSNVNKIYSTAQMISEMLPPTGVLTSIENAHTENVPATIPAGHAFGWLKKAPTATSEAGNHTRVSGQYWLELWSTDMYATV